MVETFNSWRCSLFIAYIYIPVVCYTILEMRDYVAEQYHVLRSDRIFCSNPEVSGKIVLSFCVVNQRHANFCVSLQLPTGLACSPVAEESS